MSDIIETTTDTISTPTGIWFYASRFLLQKYNLEDIGQNQFILSEWLKENNQGKVDGDNCFITPNTIIVPKDRFNVLRIIGVRLFEANTHGEFYINHAIVLNIRLMESLGNQNILLGLINKYSFYQYRLYRDGFICRILDSENRNGSRLYSTILEKGVRDTDTVIEVYLRPTGIFTIENRINENIINRWGGGATFSLLLNRGLIYVAVTGRNGYSRARNKWDIVPEYVLMHELAGHAIPQGMEGLDRLSSVGIESEIAKELGIAEDRVGDDHPVRER
jgi:hypothetical protein